MLVYFLRFCSNPAGQQQRVLQTICIHRFLQRRWTCGSFWNSLGRLSTSWSSFGRLSTSWCSFGRLTTSWSSSGRLPTSWSSFGRLPTSWSSFGRLPTSWSSPMADLLLGGRKQLWAHGWTCVPGANCINILNISKTTDITYIYRLENEYWSIDDHRALVFSAVPSKPWIKK